MPDVAESLHVQRTPARIDTVGRGIDIDPVIPAPIDPIKHGAVYPGEPSWKTPEERRAALARWVAVIAREVGARYSTFSERTAATEFVRSYRLTIPHAFHRKLVRKDVVAELTRLFEQSKVTRMNDHHEIDKQSPLRIHLLWYSISKVFLVP